MKMWNISNNPYTMPWLCWRKVNGACYFADIMITRISYSSSFSAFFFSMWCNVIDYHEAKSWELTSEYQWVLGFQGYVNQQLFNLIVYYKNVEVFCSNCTFFQQPLVDFGEINYWHQQLVDQLFRVGLLLWPNSSQKWHKSNTFWIPSFCTENYEKLLNTIISVFLYTIILVWQFFFHIKEYFFQEIVIVLLFNFKSKIIFQYI